MVCGEKKNQKKKKRDGHLKLRQRLLSFRAVVFACWVFRVWRRVPMRRAGFLSCWGPVCGWEGGAASSAHKEKMGCLMVKVP